MVWLSAHVLLFSHAAAAKPEDAASLGDLKRLSLEDLMKIEVTSISRQSEKLSEAPSAIQVITAEDIRRSGVATLPEALSLASNLFVARANAREFAITSRGFNNVLADKLLVLLDGRSLYTPRYGGVVWEIQQVILDNVERIEVISGPGGAVWGSNAVNGVINIVTKEASRTQGIYAEGGVGSFMRDFAGLRYGGTLGGSVEYRVYGQYLDHGPSIEADGEEAEDQWGLGRGGFRADWNAGRRDLIIVQGEMLGSSFEQPNTLAGDIESDAEFIQARWNHEFTGESEIQLKGYFDRTWRKIPGALQEELRIWDIDFLHWFPLGSRHNLIWGLGYRLTFDDVDNGRLAAFIPEDITLHLPSGFLQDQVAFLKDRLRLTLGLKAERNDFSGMEVMPSARIAWHPPADWMAWAALSRAIRSPSRLDVDAFIPAPPVPDSIPAIEGGPGFGSEELIAYEAGLRSRPWRDLSLSLSGFVHDYDDLRILQGVDTLRSQFVNGMRGVLYGVELYGDWQAAKWWKLRGGYTFMVKDLEVFSGLVDESPPLNRGNDPGYQALLQSSMDFPRGWEVNAVARLVDRLPDPPVPGYLLLDAGAAWNQAGLTLSIYARNLIAGKHVEFFPPGQGGELFIPYSVTGRAAWGF